MKFHPTHGSAIFLSTTKDSATRNSSNFCNGLVFSDQPIRINQRICLELDSISLWSGGIRIGVTSVNPASLEVVNLPRFAYPDLANKDGYWVRVISESLTCTPACRLTVYLNSSGQLQLFINGNHKGALLVSLPTNQKLWLMLDIYGNTNKAAFVNAGEFLFNSCFN